MNFVNTARKIRALIVDDEPPARDNLRALLRRDAEIEIVGECGTGRDAVSHIRSERPDLVFLDVQMPEWDGFDVLELLGPDPPPVTVFVTAYDKYALQAFEAGAPDYVLKPFSNSRFELALQRAKQRVKQLQSVPGKLERLAIKNPGEVIFINIADIDWIEAANYYACLHVHGRAHLLRRSITDLARALDGGMFCRIHRSTIVNLGQVQALAINESGNYEAKLRNGTSLRVSERYRKQLKARLALL